MTQKNQASILFFFEQQVAKAPDNIALIFNEYAISYRELNAQANQLSRWLLASYHQHYHQSLPPDTLIAIAMERNLNMIVSIIAVLKAGAAYLPLDSENPIAYFQYIIDDAQPKLILTSHSEMMSFKENFLVLDINVHHDQIKKLSTENLSLSISPESLAYVIYTSGSTGKPKGVLVQHDHLFSFWESVQKYFQFTAADTWTLFHSFSFDFSIWELWGALLHGAKLLLISYADSRNPSQFYALVQKHCVTVLSQTTSAFLNYMLIDQNYDNVDNASLRYIFFGGEKLLFSKLESWFAKWGDQKPQLIHVYGVTEATIFSTYYPIKLSDLKSPHSIIGLPLPGLGIHLLDTSLRPVSINTPGEIYIGGKTVTRGYLHRDDLTKQNFIINPEKPEERLYKTGDFGMYLANNQLTYLQRQDTQVKFRGFRIETSEIEIVLEQHINVALAQIQVETTQINAYIVLKNSPNQSKSKTIDHIRLFCIRHLPYYMIPDQIFLLKELPTTLNGKIDLSSLPHEEKKSKKISVKLTSIEQNLLFIWKSVFKKKNIRIDNNFFDLGGNSIIAMQLIARIGDIFGYQCSIATLFTYPTINKLASILEKNEIESFKHNHIFQNIPLDSQYPASSAQEELWFIHQYETQTTAYNEPFLFQLTGFTKLNISLLNQTLQFLLERHENLRTHFVMKDHSLLQVVEPASTIPLFLKVEYISSKQITLLIQKPFDLMKGPLIRSYYLESKDDHYILIVFHHIIMDGVSVSLFFKEFSEIYLSLIKNRKPDLQPISIQYKEYSSWQKQQLNNQKFINGVDFWKKQLNDYKPLNLHVDFPRAPKHSFVGEKYHFKFSNSTVVKLMQLAKNRQITLFVVMLTALNVLLYRYTQQQDIIIGIPLTNRTNKELENTLGYFINLLPICTHLQGNPRFYYLMEQIQNNLFSFYAHQDVPLKEILKTQNIEHRSDYLSFIPIAFVYQTKEELPILKLPEIQVNYLMPHHPISKFDITIYLKESLGNNSDYLSGFIEFNTALFKLDTIQQLIDNFKLLLDNIAIDPAQFIHRISCQRIPNEIPIKIQNHMDDPSRKKHTLSQLFEKQVKKTPHHKALSFLESTITYEELNTKANQMAHWIINHYQIQYQQSLSADTLIGLCMERSIEMVIALIAILKTGAAYVPLSPAYPDSHLQDIVEDAKPIFILTHHVFSEKFKQFATSIPLLLSDQEQHHIQKQLHSNLSFSPSSHDLAYIIYTSGSTGKSKGVAIQHNHLYHLFEATQPLFQFNENDVWTLFHSFAFDFSVWELWGALLYGGHAVMVSSKETLDPYQLHTLLIKHQVTVLNQTPLAWVNYMPICMTWKNTSLRYIILGGEKLILHKLKPWFNETWTEKKPALVNMYGITEITVHATYHFLQKEDTDSNHSIVGKPLPHLQIHLLDQYCQPVLPGAIGEIYVSGKSLAREYWHQTDLTQKAFVLAPWDKTLRLYKSGDFARCLPSGNLAYMNRKDHQVKIRGFRIETDEIENILGQHPRVKKVFVICRESHNGNKYLLAYYVSEPTHSLTSEALYQYSQEKLSPYKIPSYFISLDKIPLTYNGKINIKELPLPTQLALEFSPMNFQMPINEFEALLTSIWCHVLERDTIHVHDNFFSLGGDSIRAVQIIYEINHAGISLQVNDLFIYQTIHQLAKHIIHNRNKDETKSSIPWNYLTISHEKLPVNFSDFEDFYPASGMQLLMLADYKNNKQNEPVYHTQCSFTIRENDYCLADFKKALEIIIYRHAPLRAVFFNDVQLIRNMIELPIFIINLFHLTSKERKAYISELILKDKQSPFNTDDLNELLFRFYLLELTKNSFEFIISMHHAIEDGWSSVELLNELIEQYKKIQINKTPPEVATNSHKEFIALEKEISLSTITQDFWKHYLQSIAFKALPEKISIEKSNNTRIFIYLDSKLTKKIFQLAKKLKVAVKTIFLSVFTDINHDHNEPIGIVTNGRTPRLSDPLKSQGLFWNILPFFVPDFENKYDQIKQTQKILIEMDPHIQYPLKKLLENLNTKTLFSYTFNFVYFHHMKGVLAHKDIQIKNNDFHDKFSYPFNLIVSVSPLDEAVTLRVEYDPTYFTQEETQKKIEAYVNLLEKL